MNGRTDRRTAAGYVVLTTALSWGVWGAGAAFAPERLLPFVLAGAWVPSLVAVGFAYREGGRPAVRSLLARLVRWRVAARWYAVAVFAVPAAVAVAAGLHLLLGGSVAPPSFPADLPGNREYLLLPVVFLVNVFVGGPLAEELGWRGYLHPRVESAVGVAPAGLAVGVVWGLWHLPFFVFPGGDAIVGGLSGWWFVPLVALWSVVFAWVVSETGSVLLAVLLHASLNTTIGTLGVLNGAPRLRLLTLLVTLAVAGSVWVRTRRRIEGGRSATVGGE